MASAPASPLLERPGNRRPARTRTVKGAPPSAPRFTALGPAASLGVYTDAGGQRELLALARPDSSTLVLDTAAGSLTDVRVVAHLSADEPSANARLMADMYLSDPTRGCCRRLSREDLSQAPRGGKPDVGGPRAAAIECPDSRYAICAVTLTPARSELRWTRCPLPAGEPSTVTLRETIGTLERYEPARSLTLEAVANPHPSDACTRTLRHELARSLRSPIVLNRGLREAVARALTAGSTMSEIAMRCGRFKWDANGNRSGETSWLARRIGQMPEGGQARATPWIHSDTLALIARDGLHLRPGEVEL